MTTPTLPVADVSANAIVIVGCVFVKVELEPITEAVEGLPKPVNALAVVGVPKPVATVAPLVSESANAPVATVVAVAAVGTA